MDDFGDDTVVERRKRMTEEEIKGLAKAVAKETVDEVFKQMAEATGKGILTRLWWIVLGLLGFAALKFGIVKWPPQLYP